VPFAMVDDEDGLTTCHVTISGPEETPYADGKFVVCLQLPEHFPMKSPSVAFKTKVWHPNVEKSSGSVCLDVLQHRWTPITHLVSVVETYLPQLLQNPNVEDPLNASAAGMMKDDANSYADHVRLYTRKYAMADDTVELPELADSSDYDFDEEDDDFTADMSGGAGIE